MRVFLLLFDARPAVVGREDLLGMGWAGRFVAEDSLNGAISEIRRALRSVGADDFQILTIPKTGYRLQLADEDVSPDVFPLAPQDAASDDVVAQATSRRHLLGLGAAGLLVAAAAWQWRNATTRREADDLLAAGLIALRQGLPRPDAQGVQPLTKATTLEPDNARAWGLLALALKSAADYAPPAQVAGLRQQSERAARRALALDPRQADAKTALALLTPSFGRWLEAERGLREILDAAPENPFALAGLSTLLMSTGQVRQCLEILDRLDKRDPLSPNLQFRRVYTLWSVGRLRDADATADRALQSWPDHPAVWFARLWSLAFTGRAERARRMLADTATRPDMPAPAAELLALSLSALQRPEGGLAERAIAANIAAAERGPAQAIAAIMVLSGLGAGAEALQVARGFLSQRGDVVVTSRHSARQASITDQHHRMTMMLWIPATEAMRRQPDFLDLCGEIGLVDYWRARGVRPDASVLSNPAISQKMTRLQ